MAKKKKKLPGNYGTILETARKLPVDEQRKMINEMMVDNYGNVLTGGAGSIIGFSMDRKKYVAPTDRKERRKIAEDLWNNNPIAKWFVRTVTSFVVGDGFEVTNGDNPYLKKIFEHFEDLNDLQYYIKKFYSADMLHGEGFYRCFVAKKDGAKTGMKKGDVLIRRMATNVVDIDFNAGDPQDVNFYQITWYDPENRVTVVEKILPYDKFLEKEGITDDEISYTPGRRKKFVIRGDSFMFHFKMNDLPNSIYGNSDLLCLFEWIDLYAEHLRNGVLQSKLRGCGAYDITIDTEDEEVFNREAAKYDEWSLGDNLVHNKNVETDVREFTSTLEGFEELRRALLLMIITGTGLSEHYTGDSASGSRAQGQTMELPQMKTLEERQSDYEWFWRKIFKTIAFVQLSTGFGMEKGIKESKDDVVVLLNDKKKFTVKLPSVSKRDRAQLIENLTKEKNLGTVSVQTMSKELGRNYEEEQQNVEEYIKKYGKNADAADENKDEPTETTSAEDKPFPKKDEPPEKPDDGTADKIDRTMERKIAPQG